MTVQILRLTFWVWCCFGSPLHPLTLCLLFSLHSLCLLFGASFSYSVFLPSFLSSLTFISIVFFFSSSSFFSCSFVLLFISFYVGWWWQWYVFSFIWLSNAMFKTNCYCQINNKWWAEYNINYKKICRPLTLQDS